MLPIRAVCCPCCSEWIDVADEEPMVEALWMHEYECAAIEALPLAV